MLSNNNIKLSTRTGILFFGGLILTVAFCIALTWYFFLKEINHLEVQTSIETNRQAQETIHINQEELARRIGDWSFWDETYNMITNGDDGYHERNLNAESLNINDLTLMIFLDRQGKFVDGAQLNHSKEESMPVPKSVLNAILDQHGIGQQLDLLLHSNDVSMDSISGIINVLGEPMLVTFSPVTSGNGQTKIGGWLIWAKRIHDFFPDRYQTIIGQPAELIDLPASHLASNINEALIKQGKRLTYQINDHDIDVYSVLSDINHEPACILKTTAPREFYLSGYRSLITLIMLCLISGFIIASLLFRELRRTLGNRLQNLEAGLRKLASNDFETPMPTQEGTDEVAMVSQVVNQLLSDRKATGHALEEVEMKFSTIFENASQPMMIVFDKQILTSNQATANLLGFDSVSDIQGHTLDSLLCQPNASLSSCRMFYQRIANQETKFEWDMVGNLGWLIPCELEITRINHEGKQALLLSMHDISERRLHENKIRRLVFNDSLTGLFNRYALMQRMKPIIGQLTEETQQFALLYINLDRFRAVNDSFGHDVGDQVIKAVALRLNIECETDTSLTLARIAGDEFIVFMPYIGTHIRPLRMSYQLHKLIEQPLVIDGISLEISSTISVIIGGKEYSSVEDILRCADFAMNKAKSSGKPVQTFSYNMYQEALETLAIQRDLLSAIRDGQIQPVFQPIVRADTSDASGFEALARWHHQEFGPISPARFIPLAEESNMIVELGEQILRQSCLFIKDFNSQREKLGLSSMMVHVNFSAHHFSNNTLIEHLRELLEETQVNPRHIVIEITESMLIERPTESVRRMQQLKEMGIGLALDDFGTGYSALNTLCQYPLDIVKLDRSFILRLTEDKQGEVLVKAIVNMSKDLGLSMVAEGVETHEQMTKIRELGVKEIQGFYYYRPMPMSEIYSLFLPKNSYLKG